MPPDGRDQRSVRYGHQSKAANTPLMLCGQWLMPLALPAGGLLPSGPLLSKFFLENFKRPLKILTSIRDYCPR